MNVTPLPRFTPDAHRLWDAIPADVRPRLLANVWCGHCRDEVTITRFHGETLRGDLVLRGHCARCDEDVARVIESA